MRSRFGLCVSGRLRRGAAPWLLVVGSLCAAAPARAAAELVLALGRAGMSLPLYVARAEGYFAAEGVNVRLLECGGGSGRECLRLLHTGTAQLATSSELPVVFSGFEGAGHAIVATLATSNRHIRIVGHRGAGVATPQQLTGKRVGTVVGSSSQYFLDLYLLFHGVDPKQVSVIPLEAQQLVGALERREIDAFAGFIRQTEPVLRTLGGDGVLLPEPRLYTEQMTLVASREMLAQRRDEVVRLLRAVERAERFIATQPQRARELLQAVTGAAAADVALLFSVIDYRLGLEQSLVSTMEGEARWALREGHVAAGQKPPNFLSLIDFGPLRAAVPAAPAK